MKASFLRRMSAYLIDMIFLGAIIVLICSFIPESKSIIKLQSDIAVINEDYLNRQITTSEYLNKYSVLMYKLDNEKIINLVINFLLVSFYFIVLPFITKGKTLGKYIMRIKIEPTDEKLFIWTLFLRNLVINGLGYLLLSFLSLLIIPKEAYIYIITILGIIQFILVISSAFMIIYRKDKRAIDDIISNSVVVKI